MLVTDLAPQDGGRKPVLSGLVFPLGRELGPAHRTRLRTRVRISTKARDRIGPARWVSVTELGKGIEVTGQAGRRKSVPLG